MITQGRTYVRLAGTQICATVVVPVPEKRVEILRRVCYIVVYNDIRDKSDGWSICFI
jgi:hypothetical protein